MVEIPKYKNKDRNASKRCLAFTIPVGLFFIVLPCVFIYLNPILMVLNYQLRLASGTLLDHLIQNEMEASKITIFLFNITNADAFLAEEEEVLKLEEVGPFVYQEYRVNKDLEWITEQNLLRYTPGYRTELVLEESVGRPENFNLIMPNIVLLSFVQMLSKYPYFIRQLFKVLTSGTNISPLTRINAYDYLWNNSDPMISTVNGVIPGLIYYNSTGILTRFYDADAKYRLYAATSDLDKFQIKTIQMFVPHKTGLTLKSTVSYNNTYEGAAFPPQLSADLPIELYRHRICRTLKLAYSGRKHTKYGSEAFVYNIDNTTFNDHVCDSKGWCPRGLLDLSSCYSGFPFILSKGHFYDTEPKMFDKLMGLKPNRSVHETELIIDPNIGVTLGSSASIQLSMALGDMSLLPETRALSDIFLPVVLVGLNHPKMPEEAERFLRLLYTYGPYMLIAGQVLSALIAVILLAYSVKIWRRAGRCKILEKQFSIVSNAPLLN